MQSSDKIQKMTDEWPNKLESETDYTEWINQLASNAVKAAVGNATDASESGDLADTPESRLEYEVELEVDDKIGFAVDRSPRLFYDIVRLSSKSLDDTASLSTGDQPQKLVENIVFNILQRDVEDEAIRLLEEE